MTSMLAALALATPLFGFSLTPPDTAALTPSVGGMWGTPFFAQLDGASDTIGASEAEGDATDEPSDDEATEAGPSAPSGEALAAALRQRQEIATVHRAFGIATWASMLVTVALGFIQYYNLYGFFGGRDDTPCVNGDAVFGQDQCWGAPWPHRIAALTTTALYATTFVLSFVMPDPLGASEGPNAGDLRVHEALRWVHLGGMIAQVLLGFAVGQNWFGIDRANDFGAMQAIATVHQVIGLATFGVLTAAGAIMIF